MAPKTALVILAYGADEMEFVISVGILRRAGIAVLVAGLDGDEPVKCCQDVVIHPDTNLEDAKTTGPYDAVVLPGGLLGSTNLATSALVGDFLIEQDKAGRIIGATCTAPIVLKAHGVGIGKRVTSCPAVRRDMMEGEKYTYCEEKVVVDGNIVTSQGPSTTFEFALTLAEKLVGKKERDAVAKQVLYCECPPQCPLNKS